MTTKESLFLPNSNAPLSWICVFDNEAGWNCQYDGFGACVQRSIKYGVKEMKILT